MESMKRGRKQLFPIVHVWILFEALCTSRLPQLSLSLSLPSSHYQCVVCVCANNTSQNSRIDSIVHRIVSIACYSSNSQESRRNSSNWNFRNSPKAKFRKSRIWGSVKKEKRKMNEWHCKNFIILNINILDAGHQTTAEANAILP